MEMGFLLCIVLCLLFNRDNHKGNDVNVFFDQFVHSSKFNEYVNNYKKCKSNVVKVEGNVYNPGFVAHPGGRISMSKALELAGGYKPNSLKKRAYVVRANGEIEKANIFRGNAKRIFPGDKIFIPVDLEPSEFNITDFISDLSVTLTNIAAILILIINVVGGLIIGTTQHDLSFTNAAENYVILSVGDGLVAQIPSLLLAMATAVIVTRISSIIDLSLIQI